MLAWVCDLIIATDDAFFQDPVNRMGIPGVEYFAHALNCRRAWRRNSCCWRSDERPAAEQFGMVNRIVTRENLRAETAAIAAKLAAQPRLGNWLTKQAINHVEELRGKRTAMDAVFSHAPFCACPERSVQGNSIAGLGAKENGRRQQETGRRNLMQPSTTSGAMQTLLTERLGCMVPVIQTAMGWVAEPALVVGSSNAGAFGFLGAAVMTPDECRAKILPCVGAPIVRSG